MRLPAAVAASVLSLALATPLQAAPIITFDDLPADTSQTGNTYDALDVHLSSLVSIPTTVDDVNQTPPIAKELDDATASSATLEASGSGFDDLIFDIPEPGMLALIGLGLIVVISRRVR